MADIIGTTDFGEGLAGGLPSQGLSDLMRGEFGLPTKSNPLAPALVFGPPTSWQGSSYTLELGQGGFGNLRVALGVEALGPKCSKASIDDRLEHDPEKWEPVFGKRSCSNKELERDDDSKKNHPA